MGRFCIIIYFFLFILYYLTGVPPYGAQCPQLLSKNCDQLTPHTHQSVTECSEQRNLRAQALRLSRRSLFFQEFKSDIDLRKYLFHSLQKTPPSLTLGGSDIQESTIISI